MQAHVQRHTEKDNLERPSKTKSCLLNRLESQTYFNRIIPPLSSQGVYTTRFESLPHEAVISLENSVHGVKRGSNKKIKCENPTMENYPTYILNKIN